MLFLYLGLAAAGSIDMCNACALPVNYTQKGYDISYTICSFDTLLIVSRTMDEPVDWLFLGIECDDRCPVQGVAEGYLCSREKVGYFELDNGRIAESFTKLEFHHFNCSISEDQIRLHMHRFLPNAWIKDTTIPYYMAHGTQDKLIIENVTKFDTMY